MRILRPENKVRGYWRKIHTDELYRPSVHQITTVTVTKATGRERVGHVAYIREMQNVYENVHYNLEWKTPLYRPRR